MASFKKGDNIISTEDETIKRAILNSGYVEIVEEPKEEKPKKGKKGV